MSLSTQQVEDSGLSALGSALNHVGLQVEKSPVAQWGRAPRAPPQVLYRQRDGGFVNKNREKTGKAAGSWRSDANAHRDVQFVRTDVSFDSFLILNVKYACDPPCFWPQRETTDGAHVRPAPPHRTARNRTGASLKISS